MKRRIRSIVHMLTRTMFRIPPQLPLTSFMVLLLYRSALKSCAPELRRLRETTKNRKIVRFEVIADRARLRGLEVAILNT